MAKKDMKIAIIAAVIVFALGFLLVNSPNSGFDFGSGDTNTKSIAYMYVAGISLFVVVVGYFFGILGIIGLIALLFFWIRGTGTVIH